MRWPGSSVARLKAKRDVSKLLEALDDKHPQVRREAAEALAEFHTQDVFDGLLALAGDPDSDVAGAVAESLEVLIRSLDSDHVLAGLGVALRSRNQRRRQSAVHLLGLVEAPRAVRSMAYLFTSGAWGTADDAMRILVEVSKVLGVDPPLLEAARGLEGWKAVEALGKLADARFVAGFLKAAVPHFDWVGQPEVLVWKGPKEVERKLLKLLGEHREQALPELIEALTEDVYTAVVAAHFLGRLEDERAVEPLTAVANSGRERAVTWAASNALREIGLARVEALYGSGQSGPLVEELRHADAGMREPETNSEGANKEIRARATVLLGKVLGGRKGRLNREAAERALAEVDDSVIVGDLVQALREVHQDEELAAAAAEILGRIPGSDAVLPDVVSVLSRIGVEAPPEFERLLKRMRSPDADAALTANRERFGSQRAREQVRRLLRADRKKDSLEYALAWDEVRKLGDESVVPLVAVLRQKAADDDWTSSRLLKEVQEGIALRLLVAIGTPMARQAIEEYRAGRLKRNVDDHTETM